MKAKLPHRFKTITELHRFRQLPDPLHPLISVIDYSDMLTVQQENPFSWYNDFYSISSKRTTNTKLRYGQQEYDFDAGVLFFIAPGQVFSVETDGVEKPEHSGWLLLVHPEFLAGSSLAKTIDRYEYFDYAVSEALFLSDREEKIIASIMQDIRTEYETAIDQYTQSIIISRIETLLNYSERFYQRQFITRKPGSHRILEEFESLLNSHFSGADLLEEGLPSVQVFSDQLHLSPNYLSNLLKLHSGLTTQQHIQRKLLDIAKLKLTTSNLSISEIAFELGFEHAPSFSKFFKSKTSMSPQAFRQSFN